MEKKDALPIFGAKVMEVIVTTLDLRGAGTSESPYSRITQFWSLDGELLGKCDPTTIIRLKV